MYLDHNATTPVDPEVRAAMCEFMDGSFGNPSSSYLEGRDAHAALQAARGSAARLINASGGRIIFTAGGSEANNLAIKGIALKNLHTDRRRVITSRIEHPSVLQTCEWLRRMGFVITHLPVDHDGIVDPMALESSITADTCLVTVMTANNETGSIQPVSELARICRDRGIPFHTDATQAAGKIPLDIGLTGADMLTLSSHKFYGPKGMGILYVREGLDLEPLIHGGGQEGGLRAGTENTPGIVGFGKACELALARLPEMERVRRLRDMLEEGIKEILPSARLNGHLISRLPNTLNILMPGQTGESLVSAMDERGISISSGAACKAGSLKPSHVLTAMGLSDEEAISSVRISLGLSTTEEEIRKTLDELDHIIRSQ